MSVRVHDRMPTGGSLTGSAFVASVQGMNDMRREREIERVVLAGNVPSRLKRLEGINVSLDGHRLTWYVMPDVLAVGTDRDRLRVPLLPATAQRIADAWGMLMPTTRMVDQIATASTLKLVPRPLMPGRNGVPNRPRSDTALYVLSNRYVEDALNRSKSEASREEGLVSGAKKHVVIGRELATRPHKVLIYGWYYPTLAMAKAALGRSQRTAYIQPYSWVHADTYVDYSHGIQLASDEAVLDGQPVRLRDVLAGPLAALVSSQGRLSRVAYPT